MFLKPLLGVALFFTLSPRSTAAPIIIEDFNLAEGSQLSDALNSLVKEVKFPGGIQKIELKFENPGLRKVVLPKIQVRRVFLVDILTALSSLSSTNITYQDKKITVSRAKEIVSETPATNTDSDLPRSDFTPLDAEQPIVQLYHLGKYLTEEETPGYESLILQLRGNLEQTTKFRGDPSSDFEFHYIESAESVYLKAPVQFHLNLASHLASLPLRPVEVEFPVEDDPPLEKNTMSSKSDLTVLVTAIHELSSQVEALRSVVQKQQKTIDKLTASSSQRPE